MKWKLGCILLLITQVCFADQLDGLGALYELFLIVVYIAIAILFVVINLILFSVFEMKGEPRRKLSVNIYAILSVLLSLFAGIEYLRLTNHVGFQLFIPLVILVINVSWLIKYNPRSKE